MSELSFYLSLALAGISSNLLMILFLSKGTKVFVEVFENIKYHTLLNNRGEVGAAEAKEAAGKSDAPPVFTQEKVDQIVQDRLARERQKYADYDTMRQKLNEFEKMNSEKAQKDLEAGKQYEEAKKNLESKLKDYEGKLTEKDRAINDMKIGNSLTAAISLQNGYVEETSALLKGNTILDQDGSIKVKIRDTNGVEQLLPVEEGVKRFLTSRPHLIKSTARSGSGTGSSTPNEPGDSQGTDLNSLNIQLQQALKVGDFKKAGDLKGKIKLVLVSKGVNL